jgi:hypothetical protein
MGLFSSIILIALTAGFFAGHGTEFPPEIVPMIVAVLFIWFAIKATEQISHQR